MKLSNLREGEWGRLYGKVFVVCERFPEYLEIGVTRIRWGGVSGPTETFVWDQDPVVERAEALPDGVQLALDDALVVPVVGCVVVREGDGALLVGRYSERHVKEYLRGTYTGPGGKREALPTGYWEDPVEAALREIDEETGCREGLRPVLAESFEVRALGYGYDSGVTCTAVLVAASAKYTPREVPAEAEKVGGWRWTEPGRLPRASQVTPLGRMCFARFGYRFGDG